MTLNSIFIYKQRDVITQRNGHLSYTDGKTYTIELWILSTMSDHKSFERPAGSIYGKCRRFPNIILFFVKQFLSTDSA